MGELDAYEVRFLNCAPNCAKFVVKYVFGERCLTFDGRKFWRWKNGDWFEVPRIELESAIYNAFQAYSANSMRPAKVAEVIWNLKQQTYQGT